MPKTRALAENLRFVLLKIDSILVEKDDYRRFRRRHRRCGGDNGNFDFDFQYTGKNLLSCLKPAL